MDIDTKKHIHLALEVKSQRMALVVPKPVGDALCLKRMEALIKEKRRGEAITGGVSLPGCFNINFRGVDD